jgi:hypothetical protein
MRLIKKEKFFLLYPDYIKVQVDSTVDHAGFTQQNKGGDSP